MAPFHTYENRVLAPVGLDDHAVAVPELEVEELRERKIGGDRPART